MLECLEATFDFLRANRRVWFRSALLLFLPICILGSLLMFSSLDTEIMDRDISFWTGFFFNNFENNYVISIVMAFVANLMIFVQVYSLLLANEASADGVEGMSIKELRPWFIIAARRSWYLPFVFVALLLLILIPFLNIALVVCLVPLCLLPSLHIIGRLNIGEAAMKSISLGFPIWFKLAFNIILVSLLGLYVFLMLFLPTGILAWIMETISTTQLHDLEKLFVIAMGFVFTVLAFFGLYVVQSMVMLVCAYHYGSLSEEKDASSLEKEVADFENER